MGDLSTQSIMGAFSICPIATCISARDDDVGERPSRHFDQSEAEWRNLPPLMVRAALRWEISGLRVSSKRFPSAPCRHASPLEMTVLASAPLVISTKALRSGEISLHHSTGSIGVGDLSTQSFIKAFSICPIPTCISARDDDVGERPSRHFDRSEAEWRNLTPQWAKKGRGWRRGLFRRAVKGKVDGPPARGFLRFLSLTRLRREGGGGGFAADDKVSVTRLAFYVIGTAAQIL